MVEIDISSLTDDRYKFLKIVLVFITAYKGDKNAANMAVVKA